MRKLVAGTRGSKLALWQTNYIVHLLRLFDPSLQIEIKVIKTKGDKILNSPLSKIGDKGLFTKEIEEELLKGEVDFAVHSLKDLPTELPEGLTIAAYSMRDYPFDVLVSRNGKGLKELPPGSVVGTSSLRRIAQIKRFRPNLKIEDIRGNVDTRLKKLERGDYDAVILAQASLERLGWGDKISEVLDYFIPAVGQGIIAVETREGDGELIELLKEAVNDIGSEAEAKAERAFLRATGGGCQVPMGAFAVVQPNGDMFIRGFISDLEGKNFCAESLKCRAERAGECGLKLAERVLQKCGTEKGQ